MATVTKSDSGKDATGPVISGGHLVAKALKNEGVKIDGHSFLTVGGITEVKEVRDTTIEWEERD